MSGTVAALLIGIGLLITVSVGVAAQVFGRGRRTSFTPEQAGQVPHVTHEQQEDIDAVNKSIEVSRSELLWLRDQVVKERTRLDQLKRQAQAMGNGQPRQQAPPPSFGPGPRRPQAPAAAPPAPATDSPWVILGLRPGASKDDIRRRYRLLSRVWHPDRFMDGPPELRAEAEVMMGRLNRAHNALDGQPAPGRPGGSR